MLAPLEILLYKVIRLIFLTGLAPLEILLYQLTPLQVSAKDAAGMYRVLFLTRLGNEWQKNIGIPKIIRRVKAYLLSRLIHTHTLSITNIANSVSIFFYSVRKPRVSTRGKIFRVHTGYKAPCELSNGVYFNVLKILRQRRCFYVNQKYRK